MIAGHLQEKKGYWYAVVTYKEDGKPTSKWFSTGLRVKGNKKKAEEFLLNKRIEFTELMESGKIVSKKAEPIREDGKTALSALCEKWLEHKKFTVQKTTYAGYHQTVHYWLLPYIEKNSICVEDVGKGYLQKYIEHLYRNNLSHKSIRNQRGMLHGIFEYAIAHEIIDANPCDSLGNMKKSAPVEKYISEEEALRLLHSVENTTLEYPVYMACIYGLRRSEVVGLKWDAVDFIRHTFGIAHVVVDVNIKGEPGEHYAKDDTKNQESRRSYPLVPVVEKMLIKLKAQQQKAKEQQADYEESGYVYVDEKGKCRIPGYITETFRKHLIRHGFKRIRFHDLRHSCASILLADPNRSVSLKDIQVWLGHADIESTMRYAHIADAKSKEHTAGLIREIYSEDKCV